RRVVMNGADGDGELALLTRAFRESLEEMRSGGFLPDQAEPGAKSLAGHAAACATSKSGNDAGQAFPLTDAQKQVWLAAQMGGESGVAYNDSMSLRFRGSFDVDVFRAAFGQTVGRHPILLARISADGDRQQVPAGAKLEEPLL